jgi:hypothetical protein
MGVYASTIRVRDSLGNSASGLAETFNKFTEALLGCGLLAVSADEVPGQAGAFVTGTPGEGETQVTLGTTAAKTVCGFNVFKHPVRDISITVNYLDIGFSAGSRAGFVECSVNQSGGSSCLTLANNMSIPLTTISADSVPLFAACGDDFLWFYVKPGNVLSMMSTNGYYSLPSKSLFGSGFGVFCSEEDPDVLCALCGILMSTYGTAPYYGPQSFSVLPDVCATRYWTFDGSLWQARRNGAMGGLFDPSVTPCDGGVRVGRATGVVGGAMRRFNFGFVNTGAVNDGDILQCDLTGGGAQKYRACFGLGPSTPSYYGATINDLAGPILPWPDGA